MRVNFLLSTLCALALTGTDAAGQTDALTEAEALALAVAAGTTAPDVAARVPAASDRTPAASFRRASAGLTAQEQTDVLGFYAARAYAPFWAEAGRAAELVAASEGASAHGLPPQRYALPDLAEAFDAGPDAAAGAEIAATLAYLRLARDLNSGLLTPSRIDEEITLRPTRPAQADLLARLGSEPLPQILADLEPRSPEYRVLMAEKARLETQALTADWGPQVAPGPTMRLGDNGARVAELRNRLAAQGYAAPEEMVIEAGLGSSSGDPAGRFDTGLETALRQFQADRGLEADGLAGPQTLAVVNAKPEAALQQILVNLERLRWMNHDLGARHVYANIPDFTVKVVENGQTVYSSRTVVGKAQETRTPEFSDEMTYFVVNPTWHIPDSIAQRVYLPKLKANPDTLVSSNMRLFTRSGTEINPGLVNFEQFAKGNFPFRIKQNPSDENALGRVKFMFPNQYAIYLHDTPLRDLFGRQVRAMSNGCVRVEKPLELAYLLLEGQVEDPVASFDAWLAAKSERTITLDRPIPVHLVYRTVFVDEAGAIQRRFDVYGRDAEVFEALEAAGVTLRATQG